MNTYLLITTCTVHYFFRSGTKYKYICVITMSNNHNKQVWADKECIKLVDQVGKIEQEGHHERQITLLEKSHRKPLALRLAVNKKSPS